jgi:hypothetical protein
MIEIIKNILKEAVLSKHLSERFFSRFVNFEIKRVGYEKRGSFGEYEPLGEKRLDRDIVDKIKNKIERITTYQFPNWKSYAVKLADLRIDPKTVYWDFDGADEEAKGKSLIYLDDETNSNGDIVYVIIRNNEVKTIMFAKSYVKFDARKLNVDMIIDDFEKIYELKN